MYLYTEPFVNKRVFRDRGKRVDRGESRKRVIPRGWFVKRNRDREIEREREKAREREREREKETIEGMEKTERRKGGKQKRRERQCYA